MDAATDTLPPLAQDGLSALWTRIVAHDFEPPHPLNFTARFARDHGWTVSRTRALIEEYRRFCFVAVAFPEPATPSQEVDELWHAHLTFTRDYWDRWCAEALRTKLHHEPSQGRSEDGSFRARYAATLARYETVFGPPPEEFWPGTAQRFARPRFRTIDTSRSLLPILRRSAR